MSTETDQKSETYRFADCIVDADRRELAMNDDIVTLQPKAFELLLYLIRNRHRAVDKDELQDALWPRSIVTETALTRCVMKARRAVGDDADKQAVIKTVHGHGYRFTAVVEDEIEPAIPDETAPAPVDRSAFNWQPFVIGGTVAGLLAAAIAAWFLLTPPALTGPVRLAVLPVENATGNPDMDWVSTGVVALMNRMLEDGGVETVHSREVSALAGEAPITQLIATGSEFREKLHRTSAATHVLGARLEDNKGLYRLTYTLAGMDTRPTRRTMVDKDPTTLIMNAVDTVTALIVTTPPPSNDQTTVSRDPFLNEAYARAMALYHEGRYQDAKELFEVIIEQEPHLFWPRYERALTLRNLRDYDGAERELIALRKEFEDSELPKERASTENALGILYMNRQRNDEARSAFEKMIELSLAADHKERAAVGYQNLALLEKNVGNLETAVEYMTRSEQTYKDMDIEQLPGNLHNNMSGLLIQLGQFEEAEQHSLAAIDAFRYKGERLYESYAMNRLADIYTRLRYYDQAVDLAEQALAVRRELDDEYGVGSSLISLADIASQRGNFTQSLQYAMQSYDIGRDIDDHRIAASALLRMAQAETRLGNPEAAAVRYADLETRARNADDANRIFRARLGIAETLIARNRFDEALTVGNELLDAARDKNRQREETAALRVFADVYTAQGRHKEAAQTLEQAYTITEAIDDSVVRASLHVRLAESYLALGDTDAAATHVQAAATDRPEDYDSLKVRARYAALTGAVDDAAQLMAEARSNAGEGWSDEDGATLAEYRNAAGQSDD